MSHSWIEGSVDADKSFYIRRFQNPPARTNVVPPFTEVYDAENGVGRRENLRKVPAYEISKGDIVLVECRPRRWRSAGSGQFGPWDLFSVFMGLQTVYILHRQLEPLDQQLAASVVDDLFD